MDETHKKMGMIKESAREDERVLQVEGMPDPLREGGFINVDIGGYALYGWIQSIERDNTFILALQSDQDPTEIQLDMAVLYSSRYTFRGRIIRSYKDTDCSYMLLQVISPAIKIQQRKYFRLCIKLKVSLFIPGSRVDTFTNDIGIGGMSVLLPKKLPQNKCFLAQINFGRGQKVELMARVVRAIEFRNKWRNCMCFEKVNYEIDQALARNLFRLEVNGKGFVEPIR